jgi:hypothetical protein
LLVIIVKIIVVVPIVVAVAIGIGVLGLVTVAVAAIADFALLVLLIEDLARTSALTAGRAILTSRERILQSKRIEMWDYFSDAH